MTTLLSTEAVFADVAATVNEATEEPYEEDDILEGAFRDEVPQPTVTETPTSSTPTIAEGQHHIRNVPYGKDASLLHPKQQLDIYLPTTIEMGEQQLPVYFHVHGGGWKRGDRSIGFYGAPSIARFAARETPRGMVAVTPSYRLNKYPLFLHDVVEALLWVVDNIAAYGGDPRRIVLSGHSAGAHIISLLLLRGTTDFGLPPSVLERIVGVVLLSGVYTLEAPLGHSTCGIKNAFFRRRYISGTFGTDAQTIDDASPSCVLLACGARDAPPPPPPAKKVDDKQQEINGGGSFFSRCFCCTKPDCSPKERGYGATAQTSSSVIVETLQDVAVLEQQPSPTMDGPTPFPTATKKWPPLGRVLPPQLVHIPFLILNATTDLGLEVDGAKFASLLNVALTAAAKLASSAAAVVQHTVVPKTNHASICWTESTHNIILRFLQEHALAWGAPA